VLFYEGSPVYKKGMLPMACECCVKNLVDYIIGRQIDLMDTKQEAAIYIKNYIDTLGTRYIQLKRRDIAEICDAALQGKKLTKREKALLINKCLTFIYEI